MALSLAVAGLITYFRRLGGAPPPLPPPTDPPDTPSDGLQWGTEQHVLAWGSGETEIQWFAS